MVSDGTDRALIAQIQDGLPVEPRPFARLAERLGISEGAVIDRLAHLLDAGVIKRLGLVVRHLELGFRANAMVVFDVPDAEVDTLGERLSVFGFVTLCYRRPRRPPLWPYNLFCMIHGRSRDAVEEQIAHLRREAGIEGLPHAVLFSRRRFKQRGARYAARPSGDTEAA